MGKSPHVILRPSGLHRGVLHAILQNRSRGEVLVLRQPTPDSLKLRAPLPIAVLSAILLGHDTNRPDDTFPSVRFPIAELPPFA